MGSTASSNAGGITTSQKLAIKKHRTRKSKVVEKHRKQELILQIFNQYDNPTASRSTRHSLVSRNQSLVSTESCSGAFYESSLQTDSCEPPEKVQDLGHCDSQNTSSSRCSQRPHRHDRPLGVTFKDEARQQEKKGADRISQRLVEKVADLPLGKSEGSQEAGDNVCRVDFNL